MSYMTISSQEKHLFLLCSYFCAHPTTLLLKILGDGCMGRPPPQIWGRPPRSPLGLVGRGFPVAFLPCFYEDTTSSVGVFTIRLYSSLVQGCGVRLYRRKHGRPPRTQLPQGATCRWRGGQLE